MSVGSRQKAKATKKIIPEDINDRSYNDLVKNFKQLPSTTQKMIEEAAIKKGYLQGFMDMLKQFREHGVFARFFAALYGKPKSSLLDLLADIKTGIKKRLGKTSEPQATGEGSSFLEQQLGVGINDLSAYVEAVAAASKN
jgi:hypothetical protein